MVIHIAIKGGLGNQLFQYALGSYFKHTYNATVFYDPLPLHNHEQNLTPRTLLLDTLTGNLAFTKKSVHKLFYTHNDTAFLKACKKFFRTINRYSYISETNPLRLALKNNRTYYFDGYWQRADTAGSVIETVNAFTAAVLKNNTQYALIKTSPDSVAIHIRRGDYVNNPFINEQHGVCDAAYYLKAMSVIEAKVNTPQYFIFSDDMAWAKKNIVSPHAVTFVEGNEGQPVTDLFLMKSCAHQIIANSSFSCWASYLNTQPGKLVIAPVNWTRREKTIELPLAEKTWIVL